MVVFFFKCGCLPHSPIEKNNATIPILKGSHQTSEDKLPWELDRGEAKGAAITCSIFDTLKKDNNKKLRQGCNMFFFVFFSLPPQTGSYY